MRTVLGIMSVLALVYVFYLPFKKLFKSLHFTSKD
jgi:hypothetical protein